MKDHEFFHMNLRIPGAEPFKDSQALLGAVQKFFQGLDLAGVFLENNMIVTFSTGI